MGTFRLRAAFTHSTGQRGSPEQQQPFYRANKVGREQVAPFRQLLALCPWLRSRCTVTISSADLAEGEL